MQGLGFGFGVQGVEAYGFGLRVYCLRLDSASMLLDEFSVSAFGFGARCPHAKN